MMFNRNGFLTTLASSLASLIVFGSVSKAAIPSEVEAAGKIIGANIVDEVNFPEGRSNLTEASKRDLQELIRSASAKGTISEIKVAAWADKDYDSDYDKPTKSDRSLSGARALAVKNYLIRDLGVANVVDYNMSERPNPLQKFTPRSEDGTGYIFTRAQKSTAVIMIYLQ